MQRTQRLYQIVWDQSDGVYWQHKEIELYHYSAQDAINTWLANELWGNRIVEVRNLSVEEKEMNNAIK